MADLAFPVGAATGDTYPSPPIAGIPIWKFDGAKWKIFAKASRSPSDNNTYGRKNGAWQETVPIVTELNSIPLQFKTSLLPEHTVVTGVFGFNITYSTLGSGQLIHQNNGYGGIFFCDDNEVHILGIPPGAPGTVLNWLTIGGLHIGSDQVRIDGRLVAGYGGITTAHGSGNGFGFYWDGATVAINVDYGSAFGWITQPSDDWLKHDIVPSTFDCLDTVGKIPLHQFRWKNSERLVPNGFIAQRIKEIVPILLHDQPDEAVVNDQSKFSQLDINKTLAVLIGAIQQVTARVRKLEDHG